MRLSEGLHDLHIDQSLAPTREALTSAYQAGSSVIASGSSSLFKAFDGVRNDISARIEAERLKRGNVSPGLGSTAQVGEAQTVPEKAGQGGQVGQVGQGGGIGDLGKTLGGIGAGIGGFFGSRYASFRGTGGKEEQQKGLRPMSLSPSKR